jgi:hypothetical protein
MKTLIAFLFSFSVVASVGGAGRGQTAHGEDRLSNISRQTSSTTPILGALAQLSPTLQPPIIGDLSFAFAGGPNSSLITPDGKYMYVLVNTYQIGQHGLTNGSNKILTYGINGDGTVTPLINPEAGNDTTGTSIYLANQGHTLLTVNSDGSSSSANTAPFEIFTIEADGSLSLVPNSIQLPAAMTVLSMVAIGSQAVDGGGQYFYAALIDNDPNDSGYMTSSVVYAFQIAPDGALRYASVFSFTLPQQAVYILNILADAKFLYIFGDSDAYVSNIGSNGAAQPPVKSTPYNDNNFFGYAFFGMQISPDGQNFYAVDSTNGSLNSLGICHYPINNDGTIQFPARDCQNIFSNVPSGESFGANGLYISPDNKFLYSLFGTSVEDTCTASMYAYTINSNGSLSALNFASVSPSNSLPIGNNFCAQPFVAGTPDGSDLYAFGVTGSGAEGYNNAIVPFRINRSLTSTDLTVTPLVAQVRELGLPEGIEVGLISKLVTTQNRLSAGQLEAACGSFSAFISALNTQNGKKFVAANAAELIARAMTISESVGCRLGVR